MELLGAEVRQNKAILVLELCAGGSLYDLMEHN